MRFFDAHCDTLDLLNDKNSLYDCDTHYNFKKAAKYDTHIQVAAIWIDADIHDPAERANALCERFKAETKNIGVIRTKHDLASANGVNVILGIEGGEPVGNDIKNLRCLFDKGVRVLTLVWNHDNAIGGCAALGNSGLTTFGKEVVSEMERLGIVVDVSHLSEKGFYDVYEVSKKPFIASHSNSKAVFPHFRNLTDEQFKCLIERRGVTGINFYPEFLGHNADIDSIAAHIEHFMALGGEDSVGLGSDFDGIECTPHGISGAEDLDKIANKLLRLNYSEELVEKISYKNMERVFGEILPNGKENENE
ncbi:MAG: dipeptidase [Clostridia bacterium]|nr:dipeptidase [Clostridia bacterium]